MKLIIQSLAVFSLYVGAAILTPHGFDSPATANAQTYEMSKKQRKAYEKRLEVMAQKVRVREALKTQTDYQEATNCTALMMEHGMDMSKPSSLPEVRAYASKVATWQMVRKSKAEA